MSLEWGAAYGGIDRRNSPPRFAHVIIWGGDLDRAFSWEWPDTPIELDDGVPRKREGALLLATRRWTGELGDLVLASPYPSGGMNGDHLVYRWTEGDLELALSLHAWDPISETIGALRAIVRSIPEW